jgi:hypothetical protein
MMEERTDIWLSGNENLRLIDGRQSGRTTKLALKYVQLALKAPGSRIIIRDHYSSNDAHWRLQNLVCAIMDTIKVDYETGKVKEAIADPGSFTGVKVVGGVYFIIATPKLPTR